jgi:hypothetical protein
MAQFGALCILTIFDHCPQILNPNRNMPLKFLKMIFLLKLCLLLIT